MATYTVTTLVDENDASASIATPGGAGLSLREAIALANANAGADVIEFDAALAGGIIRVGATPAKLAAPLNVTDALTINGDIGNDGTADITISGDGVGSDVGQAGIAGVTDIAATYDWLPPIPGAPAHLLLLDNGQIITATADLTVQGTVLTGGYLTGANSHGAAISGTNVTLNGSVVSGNGVFGDNSSGGAIFASGNLVVTNSTISGNLVRGDNSSGGGIAGNTVTVVSSTITANAVVGAASSGAGIEATSATITNSLVLGNSDGVNTDLHFGAFVITTGRNIVQDSVLDGTTVIATTTPTAVFASVTPNGGGVLAGNGLGNLTVALKADAANPAIDAADASAPLVDGVGNTRFDVTGVANNGASFADLGAAEAGELASFVVTTLEDVVDAFDGKTSLREAVLLANRQSGADTITFDASLAGGTIRLSTAGSLQITDTLTINGDIGDDHTADITISGDVAGDDVLQAGSAVLTNFAASLTAATVADNARLFFASAGLTVKGLVLTGGHSGPTVIFGNLFGGGGGAIFGNAAVAAIDTIFTGNGVTGNNASGGAIGVVQSVSLENCAIVGNVGGNTVIFSTSRVDVSSSTATGNSGDFTIRAPSATVVNSIIAGNDVAAEVSGVASVDLLRGNIISFPSDPTPATYFIPVTGTNLIPTTIADVFASVDANGAGILADDGSGHLTVALKISAANPALDAATGTPPATDARGVARQDLPTVGNEGSNFADLGAFEAVDPTNVTATPVLTSIAENTSTATAIKFADLTVVDPFNQISLALSGADASLFELHSDGIFLKAGSVLDFETNPVLDVTLTVNRPGFAPVSSAATFLVTDVNEAPTALALNNTITTLAENSSTATHIKVADIAFSDDALGTNTLSLSGADAGAFEIVAGALYLKAGTALDFETKNAYAVTVNVDDTSVGTTPDDSKGFILNVTDVNEAPTAVNFTNVLGSIAENASTAARIKVANIAITDDALGSETITLAGADAAKFEVVNGVLYIKAGAVLDFESNPSLDVTVNVNDPTVGGSIDASRALSVAITDVLETLAGGTPNPDVLNGTVGADRINGLAGNDTINGGAGNDKIIGGAGADVLIGGPGADTFIFASTTDSAYKVSGQAVEHGPLVDAGISLRDVITDFTVGADKIDVSLIDANENIAGNQAFTFRGTGDFSGPGSIVYRQFDNAGTANDHTVVYFDTTGDGRSDMLIALNGLKALTVSDFIL